MRGLYVAIKSLFGRGRQKVAWRSVKSLFILYYAFVLALYLFFMSSGFVHRWLTGEHWARPDMCPLWVMIVAVLPFLAWVACSAAIDECCQQGIEDETKGAFCHSYFDAERWVIRKHLDLGHALRRTAA